MNQIYQVRDLNRYLKDKLTRDVTLTSIFLEGEISNFTRHHKSGHLYFTLKDSEAAISAVMFRGSAYHLRFQPENGMRVVVFGSVSFYEKTGTCQIVCADMEPSGVGVLYTAFEQLKEKLQKEGLFSEEKKKTLPLFPKRIGVITAKDGAAYRDILKILSERYPLGEVILFPALVQGDHAAQSMIEALWKAKGASLDVLILGRGGGSLEDLYAFNDEALARAIFDFPVPVISAVGHETDFTIADFVADYRAPTPTAGAMAVSPSLSELRQRLLSARQFLLQDAENRLASDHAALVRLQTAFLAFHPERRLQILEEKLFKQRERLQQNIRQQLEKKEAAFFKDAAVLDQLSPLKVLTRGYAIVYHKKEIVKDASLLQKGDLLTIRFAKGEVKAEVIKGDDHGDHNI